MTEKNVFNFLLVSRPTKDADEIEQEIQRNKLYKITRAETAAQSLLHLQEKDTDCLVLNFDTFTTDKIKMVSNVRNLGYNFPVLVFASHVYSDALEQVQKYGSVVIEKPFEAKDVWGICQKSLQGQKVNQRIFRRFYTDQSTTLEKSVSGEAVNGRMYNLSRGGAYIELLSPAIFPGEMVKMSVHLDKVNRFYIVDAQVVWATQKGYWRGNPAAGVRFVKAGDVYRNLLERL